MTNRASDNQVNDQDEAPSLLRCFRLHGLIHLRTPRRHSLNTNKPSADATVSRVSRVSRSVVLNRDWRKPPTAVMAPSDGRPVFTLCAAAAGGERGSSESGRNRCKKILFLDVSSPCVVICYIIKLNKKRAVCLRLLRSLSCSRGLFLPILLIICCQLVL